MSEKRVPVLVQVEGGGMEEEIEMNGMDERVEAYRTDVGD